MSENTIQLDSAKHMPQAEGRQSFNCDQSTFFGTQSFQAIAMKEGLLLLRLLSKKASKPNPFLAIFSMLERYQSRNMLNEWGMDRLYGTSISDFKCHETLEDFKMESDEVLWSKARSRKGSSLLKYENIESVSIEPGSSFSTSAGVIQVQSTSHETIKLEVDEHPQLGLAIELFQKRCSAVTEINVEMDDNMMYRAKRG